MSTCNRLDLQTLGSQPIMPKNLPDHWPCLPIASDILYSLVSTPTATRSSLHQLRRLSHSHPIANLSLTLSITLLLYSIVLCSLTFWPLNALSDSLIACHSIQRHIVALEADSDIFNTLLHPVRDLDLKPTSRSPHGGGPFLLHLLRRWRSRVSIFSISKYVVWVQGCLLAFLSTPFLRSYPSSPTTCKIQDNAYHWHRPIYPFERGGGAVTAFFMPT
jgi:hypothetical protein